MNSSIMIPDEDALYSELLITPAESGFLKVETYCRTESGVTSFLSSSIPVNNLIVDSTLVPRLFNIEGNTWEQLEEQNKTPREGKNLQRYRLKDLLVWFDQSHSTVRRESGRELAKVG